MVDILNQAPHNTSFLFQSFKTFQTRASILTYKRKMPYQEITQCANLLLKELIELTDFCCSNFGKVPQNLQLLTIFLGGSGIWLNFKIPEVQADLPRRKKK